MTLPSRAPYAPVLLCVWRAVDTPAPTHAGCMIFQFIFAEAFINYIIHRHSPCAESRGNPSLLLMHTKLRSTSLSCATSRRRCGRDVIRILSLKSTLRPTVGNEKGLDSLSVEERARALPRAG